MPTQTQVMLPPTTPSKTTSTGESKKIVAILDSFIFNKKEKNISYNHWLLQMCNKIITNKKIILIKLLKKLYVQSRVSSDALTQFEPCFCKNSIRSFTTAIKILNTLTTAFGNLNRKQTARIKYQTLRQSNCKFSNFWVEFQQLAAELDYSKEILINNLIEKYYYTIQQ